MLYKDESGAAWTKIRFHRFPACTMVCLNCLTFIVTQLVLLLWTEHNVCGYAEYLENYLAVSAGDVMVTQCNAQSTEHYDTLWHN